MTLLISHNQACAGIWADGEGSSISTSKRTNSRLARGLATRGSEKILRTTSVGANPHFPNLVYAGLTNPICTGTLTTIKDGAPSRSIIPTVHPSTYVELYKILAKALKGEGESPVKPEGARDVLRIIEAAIVSSKEGRTITL